MAIRSTSAVSCFFLVCFVLLLRGSGGDSSSSASDVELLLGRIKGVLEGSSVMENLLLSSWNSSVPLCQWRGLKWVFSNGDSLLCADVSSPQWTNLSLHRDSSLQIRSLHLPSANLTGTVPKELSELSALQSLDLRDNALSGPVPLELGYSASLSELDLGGNLLTGELPSSLWNLCDRLVDLRFHGNTIAGVVPEPAFPNSTCENLRVLDLGKNSLTGGFPLFITRFLGIQDLDLSDNTFSGPIPPSLPELKLIRLNLSYNNFTGELPSFKTAEFNVGVFDGNPGLCGPPLKSCRASSGMRSRTVAGVVIGFMTGTVIFASLMIGYAQGKRRKSRKGDEDVFLEEEEDNTGTDGEGKLVLFQGGEHLTLEEVLNATGQVMEKATYGTVYRAKLSDGGTITLRLLREGSSKDVNSCLHVIKQLGRIRHENLVPLRAFYHGKRGEKLLIYDHLPNKSLHDILHGTKGGKTMLTWTRRHKIALGIARGLAHLHTAIEVPIIHGNIRSKNVLVDDFFVGRLVESGLEKLVVPSVSDEMVAVAKTEGYKAPELQKMKKCNPRTDVYAFGILLLEILMGSKPGTSEKDGVFVDLPSMVKAAVLEETTMEVFDVDVLKGVRSAMEEGLVHALKLAMGCCAPVDTVRPAMDEVVKQLEENRPRNRSALYSPAETRSGTGTPF